MGAPISSKDLLSEAGVIEPKGTVTFGDPSINQDKKISDEILNHPNVDKYLRYINAYEGSPKENQTVGFKEFEDLKDHPRQSIKFNKKGDSSDAAGYGQLLSKTWDEQKKKQGLEDFSLENQKRAMVGLLRDKGVLESVLQGDYDFANTKAKNIWASLPGSTIGKTTGQTPKLNPTAEAILKEQPTPSQISANDLLKEAESFSSEPTDKKTYAPSDVIAALLNKKLTGVNLVNPKEIPPGSILEKLLGGIEAGASAVTGAVTGIPATMAYGYVPPGSPQSAYDEANKRMQAIQQFQYQPKTQTGQNLVEMLGGLPKMILGTSAPLPPMLGIENQLGGALAYDRPPQVTKPFNPNKYVLNEPIVERPSNVVPMPTLKGVGAAEIENNPYSGLLSGESYGRGEVFPQIKLSKIANDVPIDEQTTRAQILQDVLKDSKLIRPGVLTGNEGTLRQEYVTAKRAAETPSGQLLKEQIANEQNALTKFAQDRVEKTGASPKLINDEERGNALNNALIGHYDFETGEFEGFKGYLNKLKDDIYKYALKKVGDNLVGSSNLDKLLNSIQFEAELELRGNTNFTGGLRKLLDLHKTEGFEGTKPNTLAGLEKLRQSLNLQWTPENRYAIGKAINAIDDDIAKAGGPGAIQTGRNLHELEKTIFGSKGMDTIFGDFDPNGIKKGVGVDKIMSKLNGLDTAQWKHIYDTADNISKGFIRVGNYNFKVPKDIIAQANMVKNEMKGSLAREVYAAGEDKAGVWNQNSVNKILNSRESKIRYAFDPEEQKAFHELNLAGQMMPGIHSYEGGAMQAERMGLVGRAIEKLPFIGSAAGATTGSGLITKLGAAGGEAGKNIILKDLSKKEAAKLLEQMQNNYNLGSLSK